MDRRGFLGLPGKGASLGLLLKLSPLEMLEFVQAHSSASTFRRALLVDKAGEPFRLGALEPHQPYVFAYPFAATPNILVNLGVELPPVDVKLPDGKSYRWAGGVGKGKGVVAYTSICPHAYSYTAPNLGAMGYYKPEGERGPRMVCCAHLSAFDVSRGGEAYASGFVGNPEFDAFFRAQSQALRELFRPAAKAREEVSRAVVVPYAEHTKVPTTCPVLG